jgi:hypothetical protein
MNISSKKLVYGLIGVVVILLVTSGIGFVNYREQKEQQQERLLRAIDESARANKVAGLNELEAFRQTQIAEAQKKAAELAQAEATAARKEAEEKRLLAVEAQKRALLAEAKAAQAQKLAEKEAERARLSELAETRLRYIAQGKVMTLKSLELDANPEQKALVAVQAYRFNVKFEGNPGDDDINKGLLTALERLKQTVGKDMSPEVMALRLCSLVSRNMTREEWENFVGSDLPYERTCVNHN